MKRTISILAILYACLGVFGAGFSIESSGKSVVEGKWFDHFYPYRIEINLAGASEGKLVIDVSTRELIDRSIMP